MKPTTTKIEGLIAKCNSAMIKNEYRVSTINGVKNLSRSDLDCIVLYCETFLEQGSIRSLMKPLGGIGEVLASIGIEPVENGIYA